MRRVIVYIDGFNLYHGMKSCYGRIYHWLDLEALGNTLLRPDQELEMVKYFTARVRGHPAARLRQVSYLEALAASCPRLKISEGRFQKQTHRCRSCLAQWTAYEEKESDVSLAVALVEDAALNRYDTALVVSADSDLCPAVRSAKRIRPESRVIAVFPPSRRSDPLRRVTDAVYFLAADKLSRAQLPPEVMTPAGIKLSRPAHWS